MNDDNFFRSKFNFFGMSVTIFLVQFLLKCGQAVLSQNNLLLFAAGNFLNIVTMVSTSKTNINLEATGAGAGAGVYMQGSGCGFRHKWAGPRGRIQEETRLESIGGEPF